VSLFIEFVDKIQCSGIDLGMDHSLRLFVGDVLTNGPVDVDEKILLALWQGWGYPPAKGIRLKNQWIRTHGVIELG
jgi:hypothetical protein